MSEDFTASVPFFTKCGHPRECWKDHPHGDVWNCPDKTCWQIQFAGEFRIVRLDTLDRPWIYDYQTKP